MINMPDGIVTVHLDGKRYRGAYYFRGDEIVVTAYGFKKGTADATILQGERGKAALNLAKLVLIDMIRSVDGPPDVIDQLALQGTTTRVGLTGSTTQIGY